MSLTEKVIGLVESQDKHEVRLMEEGALVMLTSEETLRGGTLDEPSPIIKVIRSTPLLGEYLIPEVNIYNVEPFSGPESQLKLDLGLFQMEPKCD